MTKEGRHAEEVMLKVPNGEDPYNVIGQYIQNHVTVIEDIIATIEIDGVRTNELFMVDLQEDGYFAWKSDWYEGEQNVALIDFFPVSDAEPERKKGKWEVYNILDYSQRPSGRKVLRCPFCEYLSNDFISIVEYHRALTNFCPNCGAKMDGEE